MKPILSISKSEYIRMNMIAFSDMPTTDERHDLENCMITCPVCGDDVRFMAMVFYDDNPSDCLCYECDNTIAMQRRANEGKARGEIMKTTSELYKTIGTGLAWCDSPCDLVCTRRYAATLPDKDKYPSISGDKCKANQYSRNVTFTVTS